MTESEMKRRYRRISCHFTSRTTARADARVAGLRLLAVRRPPSRPREQNADEATMQTLTAWRLAAGCRWLSQREDTLFEPGSRCGISVVHSAGFLRSPLAAPFTTQYSRHDDSPVTSFRHMAHGVVLAPAEHARRQSPLSANFTPSPSRRGTAKREQDFLLHRPRGRLLHDRD